MPLGWTALHAAAHGRDDPGGRGGPAVDRGDPHRPGQGLRALRVRIEGAESEQHVHAGRLVRVAPVGRGRLLPRRHDHVPAASPLIGAHLAENAELPLPEVRQAARGRAGRNLDHDRAGLAQVDERQRVRRGGVGGKYPELVLVGRVVDQVVAGRAEQVAVLRLPLREGDQRQRPQVGLGRELGVELVEHQPEVRPQRQLCRPSGRRPRNPRERRASSVSVMGSSSPAGRAGYFTPAG